MFDLLPQGMAIDGLYLVYNTILTGCARTDVIVHFIFEEFPTECRQMLPVF
jgi:hypothetical protein